MVPPWVVKKILIGLSRFLPKMKLVPQRDLAEMGFIDFNKKKLVCSNF